MGLEDKSQILVDIGGTNTRISAEDGALRAYKNNDFSSFESVLDVYFAESGNQRGSILISAAGPEEYGADRKAGMAERILLTNRGWNIDREQLYGAGFSEVRLFNDLYSAAYGVYAISRQTLDCFRPLCGAGFQGAVPFAVVGVGTGIGCSVFISDDQVLSTEAGHMPAAIDPQLAERFLASGVLPCHPKYERIISGLGLETLIKVYGSPAYLTTPADIPGAARAGDDTALEIIAIFNQLLGRFLTAIVVAYRAVGGVCIVSDFLRDWGDLLDRERIGSEYLQDVPRILKNAPVVLLDHDQVPLRGLQRLAGL